MRQSMSSQIAELKQELEIERLRHVTTYQDKMKLELRNTYLASDNENLLQDKKWLKALIQNLTTDYKKVL